MIDSNRRNGPNMNILMFDRIQLKVLGELLFGREQFDLFSVPEKGAKVCDEMEKRGWKFDEKMTTLFEMAVFKTA